MLQHILEFGIGNAVVAGAMALVVFGVTRVWTNQHLAHGLWLLVLIKLVAPPLWCVSVPIAHLGRFTEQPIYNTDDPHFAADLTADLAQDQGENSSQRFATGSVYLANTTARADQSPILPASQVILVERFFSWRSVLVLGWAIGTLTWLSIVVWRVVRFNRILKTTLPVTAALSSTAELVAKRLRLRRLPALRLTNAVVGPMVWPVAWRTVVVLPQQLVRQLDHDQLATIITHEFVHLQRRDHWIRFLEVVVNSLYWWNPVVWWVRRQLHAAEEACCDAQVLQLFPKKVREYGEALLHTQEFVTSGQVAAPVLSSGFGSCFLKRRVEIILSNEFGRPTSQAARFALIAVSVVVMSLTAKVIFAEDDRPTAKADFTEDDLSLPKAQIANGAEPSDAAFHDVTSGEPASKPRRSLEARVGRIEDLLEQLLRVQQPQSEAEPKKVFGFLGKLSASVGTGGDTGAIYRPVITPDGRTIYRRQANTKNPPPTPTRQQYPGYPTRQPRGKESNVDSLIEAIKKKQADIERLKLEIQQIREALGPATSASRYQLSTP
jgi:beta-lactamase regulating signal transducer with metallopeptidase domain